MHGSNRLFDLNDYKRALGWKRQALNESEMALFSECGGWCAQNLLDTTDIVREAMLGQPSAIKCRAPDH